MHRVASPLLAERIQNMFGSDNNNSIKNQRQDMHNVNQESSIHYKVVVNHEEQYSIWPIDRKNASGWQDVGKSGPKQNV